MRTARISVMTLCALLLCPRSGPSQPSALADATSSPGDAGRVYSGMLLPCKTALIKSKFDDRVAEVPYALGARIKSGQLLLRFVDDEYRVEQERAAALLERAQAEFGRAQRLHEQGQLR